LASEAAPSTDHPTSAKAEAHTRPNLLGCLCPAKAIVEPSGNDPDIELTCSECQTLPVATEALKSERVGVWPPKVDPELSTSCDGWETNQYQPVGGGSHGSLRRWGRNNCARWSCCRIDSWVFETLSARGWHWRGGFRLRVHVFEGVELARLDNGNLDRHGNGEPDHRMEVEAGAWCRIKGACGAGRAIDTHGKDDDIRFDRVALDLDRDAGVELLKAEPAFELQDQLVWL